MTAARSAPVISRATPAPLSWHRGLQVISMAYDVARGMAYLHAWSPPLIHRDLKSLNLLITDQNRLKITDFGMTRAKAVIAGGDQQLQTAMMTQCGTPYWSAPEVLQGKCYNEKVDVYAFAMVLVEILNAALPWTGNAMTIMRQVPST
jgi:serine/threonine protein kinase